MGGDCQQIAPQLCRSQCWCNPQSVNSISSKPPPGRALNFHHIDKSLESRQGGTIGAYRINNSRTSYEPLGRIWEAPSSVLIAYPIHERHQLSPPATEGTILSPMHYCWRHHYIPSIKTLRNYDFFSQRALWATPATKKRQNGYQGSKLRANITTGPLPSLIMPAQR